MFKAYTAYWRIAYLPLSLSLPHSIIIPFLSLTHSLSPTFILYISRAHSLIYNLFLQKAVQFLLVGVMCLFYFLYNGMEVSYGLYVETFSVESQLHLSKSDGAYITAIFWGSYTAMRFLAIFAAIKVKPFHTMAFSFGSCLIGAIPLALWADKSALVLKVLKHDNGSNSPAFMYVKHV